MWSDIDVTLMGMAADRGWVSDGWVAEWADKQERMAALMHDLLPAGGDAVRWGDGPGALWIGLHPVHGTPRLFAACSEAAGAGLGVLGAVDMQRARKAAPGEWVTWWDARTRLGQVTKPQGTPITVGAVVGGVYVGGGATLGIAVEIMAGVDVMQLQQGEVVSRVRPGTRWFAFTGEARQLAARQLLEERGTDAEWASYMAMRAVVAGRARKLILAGEAPQDDIWPVNLGKKNKK